jgi:hypothetical protein
MSAGWLCDLRFFAANYRMLGARILRGFLPARETTPRTGKGCLYRRHSGGLVRGDQINWFVFNKARWKRVARTEPAGSVRTGHRCSGGSMNRTFGEIRCCLCFRITHSEADVRMLH